MKPSLQLQISQHLSLTPQLQQAIRLLQLSTIELRQEIQQVIESNPLLEASADEEATDVSQPEPVEHMDSTDFQWSDVYNTNSHKNNNFEPDEYNYENLQCTTTNLQDHLRWQAELAPMGDVDRIIAATVIDAINEDGFLCMALSEIHVSLHNKPHSIAMAEIEAVRHRIQRFDPIGCGSISLQECLLVQLEQLPEATPLLDVTKDIIKHDIALLGTHDYRTLMKKHQIDEHTLELVLTTIKNLFPKPGLLIIETKHECIVPDVSVKKVSGTWQVLLNQSLLPRLSINNQYANLIQRADYSADNLYLKNHLQEARWFLKSIQSRQETLFKVTSCIVAHQEAFLEHGEEAMKPMILNDIAEALDLHESTVSRVTTQKFLHTPRGLFELKYFFSSHVGTNAGGECSSTAIRAVIKKLIAAEDRTKPLSDSKIAQLIGKQGINIARRTVAKYREAMHIAPSHERKMVNK